jgi:hypothetical protein
MVLRAARRLLLLTVLSLTVSGVQGQGTGRCASSTAAASVSSGRTAEDTGADVYLPVVMHVLYSITQQNITDAQLQSQLRVFNEDFNRRNADTTQTLPVFQPVAASARIHFYLVRVNRVPTTHGPFANDDVHYTDRGGDDAWDASQYLNVWVCDLADGVFGYGTPPGTAPEEDGIVIDYQYFGRTGTVVAPYDKGRTATHEAGHWLGLKHLWGDVGGCGDDDGIEDTPAQESGSHGCQLDRTSCGGLNMVQNFMDLSWDGCMNLFTAGQCSVMRRVLFEQRAGLIHDAGVVTGVEAEVSPVDVRYKGNRIFEIEAPGVLAGLDVVDVLGRSQSVQWQERSTRGGVVVVPGSGVVLFRIYHGGIVTVRKFVVL